MSRYNGQRGGRRAWCGRGMSGGCGPFAGGGWQQGTRGLYRSREGRFLGVCSGLAGYFDVPVFWVRFGAVLLILFTGLWPGLALYFIAALVMRLEPVVPPASATEREFYDSYARSRSDALARIRDKFDRLERRIRRMEDKVTSKDWQWERRMNQE
ncbi:envelope stress response membrane protein PspC [Desulfocurvus sp. DL9XJH121]